MTWGGWAEGWEGRTEVNPVAAHVDVIASWPRADSEASHSGRKADAGLTEIESEWADIYTFAEIESHDGPPLAIWLLQLVQAGGGTAAVRESQPGGAEWPFGEMLNRMSFGRQ